MTVVTRFAPSPTGYLHLGGVRTALFNYLFAKHYNGKFILRIEDTDDKRLDEKSLNSIVSGLEWLGIKQDGKIIIQSENILRHREVAKQLIEEGSAYYCYCSREELEEEKKGCGYGHKYSGKCRERRDVPEGVRPSIRLNSQKFSKIEFKDLIHGDMCFERDNLDDFIIFRSDGIPVYMFAVVVDDHDESVTNVIRGSDHLVNTAKQLMIYKLLSWKEPEYAHLPLIHGEDGSKMSKRRHTVDILDFKNSGFLPKALINYLMLLGWTPSKEILSVEEAIKEFGVGALHHSPARFDMKKLRDINSHYLKEIAEVNPKALIHMINDNYKYHNYEYLPKFVFHAIEQSLEDLAKRATTFDEILKQSFFYFDSCDSCDNCDSWNNYNDEEDKINALNSSIFSRINEKELMIAINTEFEKIIEWNHGEIEKAVHNLCAIFPNIKKGELMKFLRGKITKTLDSFSIIKILEILGKERVLVRLS